MVCITTVQEPPAIHWEVKVPGLLAAKVGDQLTNVTVYLRDDKFYFSTGTAPEHSKEESSLFWAKWDAEYYIRERLEVGVVP